MRSQTDPLYVKVKYLINHVYVRGNFPAEKRILILITLYFF